MQRVFPYVFEPYGTASRRGRLTPPLPHALEIADVGPRLPPVYPPDSLDSFLSRLRVISIRGGLKPIDSEWRNGWRMVLRKRRAQHEDVVIVAELRLSSMKRADIAGDLW